MNEVCGAGEQAKQRKLLLYGAGLAPRAGRVVFFCKVRFVCVSFTSAYFLFNFNLSEVNLTVSQRNIT